MATIWEHEVFVIGAAASMTGAIAALDVAFPRDDGQPRDTEKPEQVACQLSANGQAPATHYGAAFSVTEAIREKLEGMGLAATPGITYWRRSNPAANLETTNYPDSQSSIGQPWNWQQCLAAVGLQAVQVQLP